MTTHRQKPGRSAMSAVFAYTSRHWARRKLLLARVAGAILLATLADVFIPFFSGRLVDALLLADASRDVALSRALEAFAAMVALGAGMIALRHVGWMGVIPLSLGMMQDIAQETFARVQRFSTDWHANSFSGSVMRKVTRGMWAIDQLNDTLLLALLPSAFVLATTTVMLAVQWPLMGAVVAVGALAYVVMTIVLATVYIAPASKLSNAWDTRMGGTLADALGCNSVVKAYGAEAREDARLAAVISRWKRRTTRTWYRHTLSGTGQHMVLLTIRSSLAAVGLFLWWRGQATPGDVTYMLTTYFVVHGYLRDVGMHVHNLQRSVNEMEELVELHATPIGIADRADAKPIAIGAGEVRFNAVDFHYGAHTTPLYEGLSVTIKGGERVGLVGHSGSGKTTFVKLIQRLYDVNAGHILIDGQDVAQATQQSLRSRIAIVPQEPILFHRTLAENIGYGRPGASVAEIERAARLANAHDFIARLPKGYETLVGERGVKLSGGERQRIALARAFLVDAPILILDEATSSLDSDSEQLIQAAIARLLKGRTAIVIAHRLSTVRALDRILVFDQGRIVEEGPHGALMRNPNGRYRHLFEQQAGDLRAAE
ncbi:MAG: ABC transporter ATP-binding protein/permease [Hyphomicrobium sp.]|uniref:ABC transporter ATP-binding protein n=1 Tax=Hyphomicrobium sp. TaxID=82 RepID=UPI0025BFCE6C|nr:ABC transporter ATP-binding protein [Hyphomicrobium sp.]MBX9861799.1 ABC transporter ATP-binding protein/permease [Hyphomicrobium sp.]